MAEEKKGWLDFLKLGGEKPGDKEESGAATPGKIAREALQNILDKMGFFTVVKVTEVTETGAKLEIKSDEVGLVVGREGTTLDALQYITNVIANRQCGQRVSIVVEAGDYRRKQEERIQALAMDAANTTHRSGKKMLLDPMPAFERRLVHLTLKEDKRVHTSSVGEGAARRVMVIPGPALESQTPGQAEDQAGAPITN